MKEYESFFLFNLQQQNYYEYNKISTQLTNLYLCTVNFLRNCDLKEEKIYKWHFHGTVTSLKICQVDQRK